MTTMDAIKAREARNRAARSGITAPPPENKTQPEPQSEPELDEEQEDDDERHPGRRS